ncbi:MAG: hypothetical protein MZV63_22185 [Marinilabiliales bacterium]|nr:hypothetical protein [Marinilabiliales bacterium]
MGDGVRAEDVNPGCDPVSGRDGADVTDRLLNLRILRLAARLLAHRGAEIRGADEDRVDPRHAHDLVGVLHRPDMLHLDDHHGLVIGPRVVRARVGIESHGRQGAAHATCPAGRVFGRGHRRLGLGCTVRHREHDPPGAQVQNALDVLAGIPGDAHQRDAPRLGDRLEHQRRRVQRGRAVLHLHGQPIEADPCHGLRREGIGQHEPGPDGGFALPQQLLHRVGPHDSLPGWVRTGTTQASRRAEAIGPRVDRGRNGSGFLISNHPSGRREIGKDAGTEPGDQRGAEGGFLAVRGYRERQAERLADDAGQHRVLAHSVAGPDQTGAGSPRRRQNPLIPLTERPRPFPPEAHGSCWPA